MSPLLPPVGEPVDTVLVPKPLEFEAMLMVLDVDKSPPPVRPPVPVIVNDDDAAPSCVLASAGLPALVPPAATARGLIPVIVPPLMLTLLAFCVAIVPTFVVLPDSSPSAARAALAVVAPVPPCPMPNGVDNPEIVPPVISILLELCRAIDPSSRFSLADDGSLPPVPPLVTGIGLMPVIVPPVMLTSLRFCVAIDPRPKFVLAVNELDAPVPPADTGNATANESICTLLIDPPVMFTVVEL